MTKVAIGDHVVTWKGFTLAMLPMAVAFVGVNWDSVRDLESKIESRVSREEFSQHVANQNRWQDRMESKLDSLTAATVQPSGDVSQAQYVLVQLPTEAELREETIRELSREILTRQEQ